MHYSRKEAIKDGKALGYHNSEAGKSLDRKPTKNVFVKGGGMYLYLPYNC